MIEKPLRYPQLLVARHKHSNEYYAVNTNVDVLRAKLQMIRAWYENSMFYEPDAPRVDRQTREILDMTPEQIDSLPAAFKEKAIRARRRAELAQREYRDLKRDNELVERLVRAETFEEAVALAGPGSNRSAIEYIVSIFGGHEYTEWEMEELSPLA